jgi:DNA-directed RNA polymerase specialized sigma24 family protein
MLLPPPDGWTQLEKMFLKTVVIKMYQSIHDPLDRFILMASAESNYKQEDISEMCGLSQVTISKRLTRIKSILKRRYKRVPFQQEEL